MHSARFFETGEGGHVLCRLCPHHCHIPEGKRGRCGIRENRAGSLYALAYGRITSLGIDPVEKKPLYHFHPGRPILSVGSYGCNFRCDYCQNYTISQGEAPTRELAPEDLARQADAEGSVGVAYTYNEPCINWEYVRDCAEAVREAGGRNVLVTNGYVEEEPLEALLPWIDAMNVDLKSYDETFYHERCGGHLAPVLRTLERAAAGCHLEVTTLLIPGYNDAEEEIDALAAWIASRLGAGTPLHLSGYTPRYRLQATPTTPEQLLRGRAILRRHLRFVYLGNLPTADGGETRCPDCGAIVVRRSGFRTDVSGLGKGGVCAACGTDCGIAT